MSKPVTLNVRIRGALGDFVTAHVGAEGSYENVSEYVRDLIRRDKERLETEQFDRLKAELTKACNAPEDSFSALNADTVIARNRSALSMVTVRISRIAGQRLDEIYACTRPLGRSSGGYLYPGTVRLLRSDRQARNAMARHSGRIRCRPP